MNPKYIHCKCGWFTPRRKTDTTDPTNCEACGKQGEYKTGHCSMAELVATLVHEQDQRINEHAAKHGLVVWKKSSRRYVILKSDMMYLVTTYNDGAQHAYPEAYCVAGPCTYQEAMKYIRDNTPPLPEYLKR